MAKERACKVCGCTWDRACPGGCSWVAFDLCSACDQRAKSKETIAYCYASGEIEFGAEVPAGALEIARGKERLVRQHVAATARLAYDNKTLLVPGIPEAPDQRAAGNALAAHLRWLKKRERKGFRVAIKERA